MTTGYSPSRSPASFRMPLGGGGVSRLRSSASKKPPEPLRRAVADCLSAAAPTNLEASRTLREYLSTHATIDLAYVVILEHTLAERERSPAVVARCVSLLKRNLLRYKPSEETLLQIDRFCISIIAECDTSPNRKLAPWSRSLSQQSGTLPSVNANPLPVSSFATGALVKSLNYVRSLVAQHIPKRSFQPAAFAGAPSVSRQLLPTLSSLLSRSFSVQLNPASGKESFESKDASVTSVSESPIAEEVDDIEDGEFIATDVFRWRWCGDQQSSLLLPKSELMLNSQEVRSRNFLEVGAAALLVGENEAKMKGKILFQAPSALAQDHFFNIVITEVCEVIAAVHSEAPSANSNLSTISSKFMHNGKPSMDVAVSVLVKLVIDMYVLDSETAAPLTLSMLEDMLNSPRVTSKARAFDIILNLGVHAHLLEPPAPDGSTAIEEELSKEVYFENGAQISTLGKKKSNNINKKENSPAIDKFECWILGILFEVLLYLVQVEEKEESVWASSLSCLLYFVCDRGKIRRSRLKGLDIRVIKALVQISRRNSWAQIVHCKLICMMTNICYQVSELPEKVISTAPLFIIKQIDLIGGIDFIFVEFVLSNSREERRNLYLVLFDYVLHKINETCIASGVSEYSDDEVRPIATLLMLADAPEAMHISVKLGVEGIVELLRRSVSTALSTYPNNDRLVMLLEKVVEKFDTLIGSFTHLDQEFNQMIRITKSFKSVKSLGEGLGSGVAAKAKLSWTTLHSLLHSEWDAYRHNGYLWLGDILIAEISEEGDVSLWPNIKSLEQKISLAAVNDYSADLDVPISIWLLCGLLKSKNSHVRWGFLFVLERLLIRCKFLLDESEVQHVIRGDSAAHMHDKSRLEKANTVIDIMSGALSLMTQINETDRMNIQPCQMGISVSHMHDKSRLEKANTVIDIMSGALSLMTQINETDRMNILKLCLKVVHMSLGDMKNTKDSSDSYLKKKAEGAERFPLNEKLGQDDIIGDMNSKRGEDVPFSNLENASMSALLLHGQAIVPMQLVARVPAALFYWPLFQLAGAATDNIALGVSVGSKGRGNLPGGTSDIRATLLLLLIGKFTADPASISEVDGEEFFRELLGDTDARVAYYSSTFLLKRMMTEEPESYQRMLQSLVLRAQQLKTLVIVRVPGCWITTFLEKHATELEEYRTYELDVQFVLCPLSSGYMTWVPFDFEV
ncbi:hypothetical protein F511_02607 [Dorcoceras hygrometricum]|uniref:Uncharacterized protein n=1 Tax=Dorcoceras hygrometricum TaxID=472368 RepID=A0A2Z7AN59_9LAMI|nr:hypothetical protein F511_02607 [Dorcoceras hygrometricum]